MLGACWVVLLSCREWAHAMRSLQERCSSCTSLACLKSLGATSPASSKCSMTARHSKGTHAPDRRISALKARCNLATLCKPVHHPRHMSNQTSAHFLSALLLTLCPSHFPGHRNWPRVADLRKAQSEIHLSIAWILLCHRSWCPSRYGSCIHYSRESTACFHCCLQSWQLLFRDLARQ